MRKKKRKSKLEKATQKEMKEHPWATKAQATKIAKNHMKKRR